MKDRRQQMREHARKTMYTRKVENIDAFEHIPAVHPRYRATYASLYEKEKKEKNTIFFRILVCVLIFFCFLAVDKKVMSIPGINTAKIRGAIEYTCSLSHFPLPNMKEFDLSRVL